ncbi:MAG: hypothetical protein HQM13_14580 [SAR324 cluster bacterium]|nr:hypothetical protein [SAR324 cluster bacterium]
MKFSYQIQLPLARAQLWDFLMQVDDVAACLEGVDSVKELDSDHYEGRLQVKLGPVTFSFNCSVTVESRDREKWHGKIKTNAKDKRLGGGFSSILTMDLIELSSRESQLDLELESTIFGKIGEYGQPLIRKRIDRMLEGFIKNVKEKAG